MSALSQWVQYLMIFLNISSDGLSPGVALHCPTVWVGSLIVQERMFFLCNICWWCEWANQLVCHSQLELKLSYQQHLYYICISAARHRPPLHPGQTVWRQFQKSTNRETDLLNVSQQFLSILPFSCLSVCLPYVCPICPSSVNHFPSTIPPPSMHHTHIPSSIVLCPSIHMSVYLSELFQP